MNRRERRVLTVGELTSYVKGLLDADPLLADIWVRGEISNFRLHVPSGHMYFTLKDAVSQIRVVMFRSDNQRLSFRPEDGQRVIAAGRVSVYERDGQYQFYARELEPDGVGSLFLAYEQLKRKLGEEGLFDQALKRPLPLVPRAVGVVTSPTGAAIRDIITVSRRRYPNVRLVISPVQVQGLGAAADIIRGLRLVDRVPEVDVIILARGGGSIEELWAFNDENLARAIRETKHPVVTGVGHETDFTIADLVADVRAATPSNAAEVVVPSKADLARAVGTLAGRLERATRLGLDRRRRAVEALARASATAYPERLLEGRLETVDRLCEKLGAAFRGLLSRLSADRDRLAGKLDALSPLAILARGYALCRRPDGSLVATIRAVGPGDPMEVQVKDGLVDCQVSRTRYASRTRDEENSHG